MKYSSSNHIPTIVLAFFYYYVQTADAQLNPPCEICGCSFCPPGFAVGNPAGGIPIPPEFLSLAPPGFTEITCSLLDNAGTTGQITSELCNDDLRLLPEFRTICACPPLPPTPSPSISDPFDGEIDFYYGFSCANSALQLNGNRPFPRLVSNGFDGDDFCTLELTSDKAEPRAVSAFAPINFLSDPVNSVENLFWFESQFIYKIAGSAAGSADGIAAVFHQDPRVQFARGGAGGNIGVYGSSSIIIRNALVVEIDTLKNVIGQIPSDTEHDAIHVTFINNMGEVFELAEVEVETLRGSEKDVYIVHKEGRLTVSIDYEPVVDVCMNLADPAAGAGPNLSGKALIAGFTAATGQQGDKQEVLSWRFTEIDPEPYIALAGGSSPPPCPPLAARQTLAPTTPPPPPPQPTATPAPTPSPLRQARVLITVNATQVLSDSFVIAYEQACSLVLTNLPELPETTCKVEQQRVVNSNVVLTVLVEADVPGLDVLIFANLAIAALNDPLFTEPLAVIGTQLDAPAFVTVVTLMIDRVQNGTLTPGGIAVFEEACREFFTIRLGNPNFRCQVVLSSIRPVDEMPADNDNGSRRLLQERPRSLASSSPTVLDVAVTAGGGTNPNQPNTQTEYVSGVGGALSTDSSGLIQETKKKAGPRGVTDFNESNTATVMPNNPFTQFLLSIIPIIRLLLRALGG